MTLTEYYLEKRAIAPLILGASMLTSGLISGAVDALGAESGQRAKAFGQGFLMGAPFGLIPGLGSLGGVARGGLKAGLRTGFRQMAKGGVKGAVKTQLAQTPAYVGFGLLGKALGGEGQPSPGDQYQGQFAPQQSGAYGIPQYR